MLKQPAIEMIITILYFFPAFECIAQKPDSAENHNR